MELPILISNKDLTNFEYTGEIPEGIIIPKGTEFEAIGMLIRDNGEVLFNCDAILEDKEIHIWLKASDCEEKDDIYFY
jgi:hypothetical protein